MELTLQLYSPPHKVPFTLALLWALSTVPPSLPNDPKVFFHDNQPYAQSDQIKSDQDPRHISKSPKNGNHR